MGTFEDRLRRSVSAALVDYREVQDRPDDNATILGLTSRETWLVEAIVLLVDYELAADRKSAEATVRTKATVALKSAAEMFANRFPNEPARWPDSYHNELTAVHQALDQAREAGL